MFIEYENIAENVQYTQCETRQGRNMDAKNTMQVLVYPATERQREAWKNYEHVTFYEADDLTIMEDAVALLQERNAYMEEHGLTSLRETVNNGELPEVVVVLNDADMAENFSEYDHAAIRLLMQQGRAARVMVQLDTRYNDVHPV